MTYKVYALVNGTEIVFVGEFETRPEALSCTLIHGNELGNDSVSEWCITEDELCAFCKRAKATESITETDSGKEVHICLRCENNMEWGKSTPFTQQLKGGEP